MANHREKEIFVTAPTGVSDPEGSAFDAAEKLLHAGFVTTARL